MRLMIKLLLTLLVLALVLPFTPLTPGGRPLLSLGDLHWPDLKAPPLPDLKPPLASGGKQTFYRWRDGAGNLHFSDRPPEGSPANLETVEVDPDANLIQGIQPPPPQPPTQRTASDETPPSPYSPGQIKKLFDEANRIKALAAQRGQQMEEVMGKAR